MRKYSKTCETGNCIEWDFALKEKKITVPANGISYKYCSEGNLSKTDLLFGPYCFLASLL